MEETDSDGARQTQDRINAYWNYRSETYDGDGGHAIQNEEKRPVWLNTLRGLLPPAPADVLDVGTGTGFLALLLAELGHRVTGVDLSEGMLTKARQKAARLGAAAVPSTFRVGDAVDPPLPPASVDVVISRHVLWTLHDPVRAIRNWRRLVRPGGRIIAIDGLWRLRTHQPTVPVPLPGAEATADTVKAPAPWRAAWNEHYGAVGSELPLFATEEIEPSMAAFRDAGFPDAQLSRLAEIERIEQESTPDRAPATPRFVISAQVHA